MDPRLHVDKLIEEALEGGHLDASAHAGKPLPPMRRGDDGWWIRGFLDRDSLPERYQAVTDSADELLAAAITTPTLADARTILANRNAGARAWNEAAPDTHWIDIVEEPNLVDLRRQRRTGQ